MAIWNPEPSAVCRLIAASRSCASSVSSALRREEEVRERALGASGPTRPRSWYICASPSRSARSTTSVFALGTSRPLSMIVVQTSTSAVAVPEREHHLLQLVLVHLAVGDHDARLRELLAAASPPRRSIVATRLWTQNDLAAAEQLAAHGGRAPGPPRTSPT